MDPILFWNDVALEANRESHTNGKNEQTGPTAPGGRGIGGRRGRRGGACDAIEVIPEPKALFDQKHLEAGLAGPGLNEGHEFGLAVAQTLLDDRKDDPDASDDGYAASVARGAYQPDPDNPGQGFHAPFYGARSKCFAVTVRHELDPPPQPGTGAYIQALREVRSKGIAPELMGEPCLQ
jgi:hypothetical protein